MQKLSQIQIIGVLEQNVGQARVEFARFADFPAKHFGDKSEAEWLADPARDIRRTVYSDFARTRDRLELWEFLLQAARNWQPGDNVVDTWNDAANATFTDPCKGNSPSPVQ